MLFNRSVLQQFAPEALFHYGPTVQNPDRHLINPSIRVIPHTVGFESYFDKGFISLSKPSQKLSIPIIAHSSWIIKDRIEEDLALLLSLHFPKGAPVINLGSGVGSASHGLTMMLENIEPGETKKYPIHQIDFDAKTILLAKKNLISPLEHFTLQKNAPETISHYQPISWQAAMKDVPQDIQDYYARGVRELLIEADKDFREQGHPFRKDFHDLTGRNMTAHMDLDQIKRMPIFQLKPELQKNFSYQTADVRDWARSELNFKQPVMVLAMNFLYHLTDSDRLSSLQALNKKLKSGSLIVLSQHDLDPTANPNTLNIVKKAGFMPFQFQRTFNHEPLPVGFKVFQKQ